MAHVYRHSAMDTSTVLTAKAIRPTSAFGMEHCEQLMVDVSVSDKIELPSRSAYAISPTFSIADLLKPSSQAHPSIQMDLLSTNTNGEFIDKRARHQRGLPLECNLLRPNGSASHLEFSEQKHYDRVSGWHATVFLIRINHVLVFCVIAVAFQIRLSTASS
ncbi:hypothetical protein AHF37_12291 [Paragonimus kellicotti]|nr:hypothetical protein AHF37_12291 [Paragonimus kellicotti]